MISDTENDEVFNRLRRSLRVVTWLMAAVLVLVIALFVKVFSM